jgi:hypothetical protein
LRCCDSPPIVVFACTTSHRANQFTTRSTRVLMAGSATNASTSTPSFLWIMSIRSTASCVSATIGWDRMALGWQTPEEFANSFATTTKTFHVSSVAKMGTRQIPKISRCPHDCETSKSLPSSGITSNQPNILPEVLRIGSHPKSRSLAALGGRTDHTFSRVPPDFLQSRPSHVRSSNVAYQNVNTR